MAELKHQSKARSVRKNWLARLRGWARDGVGPVWQNYQWLLISVLWGLALWLGYTGLAEHMTSQGKSATSADIIYLALQLVTLESGAVVGPLPWQLEIARFALPTLAAWTAIRALALVFREQTQRIALRFAREHVVICGLSQMGWLLATRFLERKQRVVVLEPDEGNPLVEPCRALGGIVLIGDLMEQGLLQQAAVQRARLLIAASEDDGTNAAVAMQAQALRSKSSASPLNCILHIVDTSLYDLLRENEIVNHQFPSLRLSIFNVFEQGARVMVDQVNAVHACLAPDDRSCRFLVVGMGRLGEGVIWNLARTWFDDRLDTNERIRIDVIDKDAEHKCASLQIRYPHLSSACDLQPWTMQLESPTFLQGAHLKSGAEDSSPDVVFVCMDNDTLGLYAGLTLHHQLRQESPPIIIRMREQSGLAMLLAQEGDNPSPYANLHAFNLYESTCLPEMLLGGTHEVLAQALYREYVRQQRRGEPSQAAPKAPSWESLSGQEREANRKQVDRIGAILDACGYDLAVQRDWAAKLHQFTPDEIESMARMEHERWCDDLRRAGWRHAPGEKNEAEQTHPALVPWERLNQDYKDKNRNPVRELPALLARVGFKLVKRKKPGA